MGVFASRIMATVALAALFGVAAITPVHAATGADPTPVPLDTATVLPTPFDSPTGSYIVLLAEAPAASYDGGEPGLAPTTPDEGEKLDTQSREVKRYSTFLKERQQDVAAEAGVTPKATYQVTLNGFSAKMSPKKAAKLAGTAGVLRVYPDEARHPTVSSSAYLGLEGPTGVWAGLGGVADAGKGVVVGVVDTGIAPENAAFGGNPLTTVVPAAGEDRPYLVGNDVAYAKADGTLFRSARVAEGDGWLNSNYSTKLIGAKYFRAGADAAGHDFTAEHSSPRDADGHGSHTASTATGNNAVTTPTGSFSGVAPAAKVAAYKACWAGPDSRDPYDDTCMLSDVLDAIDAAVNDGVDVINYSIGGGVASTMWAPDDIAFLNAAIAGVFVAVAAGNSGSAASTADHASPWYTSVAASSIPASPASLPVVADFSSRGPILADGSDILKPDVTAPGVGILAAVASAPGASGAFAAMSGTSMAAPHVAGLAALYLGAHPTAVPAEIQSALMTTATKTGTTTSEASPFVQGAGQINPTKFIDPGLVYVTGQQEWVGLVRGLGYNTTGFTSAPVIDGSNVNLASISIGTFTGPQTVTRTLTSTRAGSYSVHANVPGLTVAVNPATVTFAGPGETKTFTVTFSNANAPAQKWATGSVRWIGADGTVVRSPVAVRPVIVDAPAAADAAGMAGSKKISITAGASGKLPLKITGLAPVRRLVHPCAPVPGHTGNQDSADSHSCPDVALGTADGGGSVFWDFAVPTGASLVQFELNSSDDAGSDLDLYVYRLDPAGAQNPPLQIWDASTAAADEKLQIFDPPPGRYVVEASLFKTPKAMTWDLASAIVSPASASGSTFVVSPTSLALANRKAATYNLTWKGLAANTRYLGVVTYAPGLRTIVTVNSGKTPPKATAVPRITGSTKVGSTLTASRGTWSPAPSTTTKYTYRYQWLRNGSAISGATASTYKTTKTDAGTKVSVRVTATASTSINPATSTSVAVAVRYGSTTKVAMNRTTGTTASTYTVRGTVTTSTGAKATGKVRFTVGARSYTRTLSRGTAVITLPKQAKGTRTVTVTYSGSSTVFSSKRSGRFTVR